MAILHLCHFNLLFHNPNSLPFKPIISHIPPILSNSKSKPLSANHTTLLVDSFHHNLSLKVLIGKIRSKDSDPLQVLKDEGDWNNQHFWAVMKYLKETSRLKEGLQVDKSLSFLNNFVQKSLEKGARPYIPENERSGMVNMNTSKNQDQLESSAHSLRFEAYELPKASVSTRPPVLLAPSTDLVTVPESSYVKECHQPASLPISDIVPTELGVKLRLDGVQKKWGKPSYSPAPSTSTSSIQKTTNGVTHLDVPEPKGSQAREIMYDSRRHQVEIPAEKQRLAASLFGSGVSSKNEKSRPSSSHKSSKGNLPANSEKPRGPAATQLATEKTATEPPPDLLDLGELSSENTPSVDPFHQLEGLMGHTQGPSSGNSGVAALPKPPDLMGLLDTPSIGLSGSISSPVLTDLLADTVKSEIPVSANRNSYTGMVKKGPNPQNSLEKDAVARQVGVTPSSRNPNLFRDLLG